MTAISRVVIFASSFVFLAACDRHSWEAEGDDPGTKMLYEHHGEHGEGHGGEHGESHGEEHAGDHADSEEHGEGAH